MALHCPVTGSYDSVKVMLSLKSNKDVLVMLHSLFIFFFVISFFLQYKCLVCTCIHYNLIYRYGLFTFLSI